MKELPDDISEANVTSIVDHHKLAGLTTAAPLEMDLRPLCSTGSVLYHRFLAKVCVCVCVCECECECVCVRVCV